MELYDVMRTTFAAREFTDEQVPDDVLHRILDNARFAASGGNRQGWKVIIVRNDETKQRLGELCWPAMRIAAKQTQAGEVYWQSVTPSVVDEAAAANDESLPIVVPMFKELGRVPVVLVVAVDLRQVASMDKNLDRVGVSSGASIYPLAWNIILSARNEGYGGAMTTLLATAEPEAQSVLGLDEHEAVAALIPLGRPVKQLTKLSRKPVEEFAFLERADGEPFRS